MLHCNYKNNKKINKLLNKYNTVGTRYKKIAIGPHYSGNFWWAKSDYIKNLDKEIGPKYLDPESWLLKKMESNKHININMSSNIKIL